MTTTTITCQADTSGRYATRARDCGMPATMGFMVDGYAGRPPRPEGRCAKHAGIAKRSRYAGGRLVDLTPEVVDAILAVKAERDARHAAERAAKRDADAIRAEAARQAAHEADAVVWTSVRADDQALDRWDGATPVYRQVPRWAVRPAGVETSYDEVEVKVQERDGWPATIEVRTPSRLTPRQAIALAEALIRAASEDEACDGFRGENAWGPCLVCGRTLDQHA